MFAEPILCQVTKQQAMETSSEAFRPMPHIRHTNSEPSCLRNGPARGSGDRRGPLPASSWWNGHPLPIRGVLEPISGAELGTLPTLHGLLLVQPVLRPLGLGIKPAPQDTYIIPSHR